MFSNRRADEFDREKLDIVLKLAGPNGAPWLLASLANEIRNRFGETKPRLHAERLATDAHALGAAAEVFGFVSLAGACRDLELATADVAADQLALLERVLAARQAALREIDRLTRDLHQ